MTRHHVQNTLSDLCHDLTIFIVQAQRAATSLYAILHVCCSLFGSRSSQGDVAIKLLAAAGGASSLLRVLQDLGAYNLLSACDTEIISQYIAACATIFCKTESAENSLGDYMMSTQHVQGDRVMARFNAYNKGEESGALSALTQCIHQFLRVDMQIRSEMMRQNHALTANEHSERHFLEGALFHADLQPADVNRPLTLLESPMQTRHGLHISHSEHCYQPQPPSNPFIPSTHRAQVPDFVHHTDQHTTPLEFWEDMPLRWSLFGADPPPNPPTSPAVTPSSLPEVNEQSASKETQSPKPQDLSSTLRTEHPPIPSSEAGDIKIMAKLKPTVAAKKRNIAANSPNGPTAESDTDAKVSEHQTVEQRASNVASLTDSSAVPVKNAVNETAKDTEASVRPDQKTTMNLTTGKGLSAGLYGAKHDDKRLVQDTDQSTTTTPPFNVLPTERLESFIVRPMIRNSVVMDRVEWSHVIKPLPLHETILYDHIRSTTLQSSVVAVLANMIPHKSQLILDFMVARPGKLLAVIHGEDYHVTTIMGTVVASSVIFVLVVAKSLPPPLKLRPAGTTNVAPITFTGSFAPWQDHEGFLQEKPDKYMSITTLDTHRGLSFEQLRLADYQANRNNAQRSGQELTGADAVFARQQPKLSPFSSTEPANPFTKESSRRPTLSSPRPLDTSKIQTGLFGTPPDTKGGVRAPSDPPLFGAQSGSGGLFGRPGSTTGIFGKPSTAGGLFGDPSPPGSGLFGSSRQTSKAGGLFGSSMGVRREGLFGPPKVWANSGAGGLFGTFAAAADDESTFTKPNIFKMRQAADDSSAQFNQSHAKQSQKAFDFNATRKVITEIEKEQSKSQNTQHTSNLFGPYANGEKIDFGVLKQPGSVIFQSGPTSQIETHNSSKDDKAGPAPQESKRKKRRKKGNKAAASAKEEFDLDAAAAAEPEEPNPVTSKQTGPPNPPPWVCQKCSDSLEYHPRAEQNAQVCDICCEKWDTQCWLCMKKVPADKVPAKKEEKVEAQTETEKNEGRSVEKTKRSLWEEDDDF